LLPGDEYKKNRSPQKGKSPKKGEASSGAALTEEPSGDSGSGSEGACCRHGKPTASEADEDSGPQEMEEEDGDETQLTVGQWCDNLSATVKGLFESEALAAPLRAPLAASKDKFLAVTSASATSASDAKVLLTARGLDGALGLKLAKFHDDASALPSAESLTTGGIDAELGAAAHGLQWSGKATKLADKFKVMSEMRAGAMATAIQERQTDQQSLGAAAQEAQKEDIAIGKQLPMMRKSVVQLKAAEAELLRQLKTVQTQLQATVEAMQVLEARPWESKVCTFLCCLLAPPHHMRI